MSLRSFSDTSFLSDNALQPLLNGIRVPGVKVFEFLEWDGYLLTTMAVVVRAMALVLRTMAVAIHVY